MFEYIDETNFIFFAMKSYNNPQCFSEAEFKEDLDRFKYLKRLFNRYDESGELRERLILNHLIPLYNVFAPEDCTRMLFWKLRGYEPYLKPFLVFLGYMPERIKGVGTTQTLIYSSNIPMDPKIIEVLRKI